ncbi:MAG: hypothetical protein ACP5PQ_01455 [Thermoproteota archaeon]
MKASVRWCSVCNVLLLGEKRDVCGDKGFHLKTNGKTDLRPFFEEERKLARAQIPPPHSPHNTGINHVVACH